MTNWKTTLFGVLSAVPQIVDGITTKNWGSVATGLCTLLLGIFAKDAGTTGIKF